MGIGERQENENLHRLHQDAAQSGEINFKKTQLTFNDISLKVSWG